MHPEGFLAMIAGGADEIPLPIEYRTLDHGLEGRERRIHNLGHCLGDSEWRARCLDEIFGLADPIGDQGQPVVMSHHVHRSNPANDLPLDFLFVHPGELTQTVE